MTQNPEQNWFGTEHVTPEQKTQRVRGVFDSVADKYDLMNDLMSGGLHRIWKDSFIRRIRPRSGLRYLDVAGGTGDIAFRIKKRIFDNLQDTPAITICDLTPDMLRVGRDRALDRGWLNAFEWIAANAESLPLPDNSYDVYTIAFGLRNVTRIDNALKEAVRVLKPGGRFFCLEFSHVNQPFLSKAYDIYARTLIPKMGAFIAKDEASYQYLIDSIKAFPEQKALALRMQESGIKNVGFSNLSAGIVAVHYGIKP